VPAYVIVQVQAIDEVRYEKYKPMVEATLEPYGGCFVVRTGDAKMLEGNSSGDRFVVLKFPDSDDVTAWWSSDEYKEAKEPRQATVNTTMILVDGV
jgi:uncharacterized protein (DUF1330 family)